MTMTDIDQKAQRAAEKVQEWLQAEQGDAESLTAIIAQEFAETPIGVEEAAERLVEARRGCRHCTCPECVICREQVTAILTALVHSETERAEKAEQGFAEYLKQGDCPAKLLLIPGTDNGVSAKYAMVLTTPVLELVEALKAKLEQAEADAKRLRAALRRIAATAVVDVGSGTKAPIMQLQQSDMHKVAKQALAGQAEEAR